MFNIKLTEGEDNKPLFKKRCRDFEDLENTLENLKFKLGGRKSRLN